MPTKISAFAMAGGLNLASPPLSTPPGECLQLHNYEVNELGRYRRVMGYERFDGRPQPSEQVYFSIELDDVTGIVTDGSVVITGANSSASGRVVDSDVDTSSVCLVNVIGNFDIGESVGVATTTSLAAQGGGLTDEVDKAFTISMLEYFRAQIVEVTGSGPIRGVVTYNDVVYCFRDNVSGTECNMHRSTSTGWVAVTTPTLSPGGQFKFDIANFSGSTSTRLLLGVDGVNKAFTFDGTTLVQLTTGITPDVPVSLAVLPAKILALCFPVGSLMLSVIGDPTDFTGTGATEIAVSDEPLELQVQPNQTLAIFCRRSVQILYGKTPLDMSLTTFSEMGGIIPYTIQPLGDSIFMAPNGLTRLARVQSFGDFDPQTLSLKVKPLLDRYVGRIVDSFMVRAKNQYRLCFDDGKGIIVTFAGSEVAGISTYDFGRTVRCSYSGLDSTGEEVILFGSDGGFVYQAEKGYSYDGANIAAICRPSFNFVSNSEQRKRFRKAVLEIDSPNRSALSIQPELDYSGPESPLSQLTHLSLDTVALGGGGYYDEALWNEVNWGTAVVYLVDIYLSGVARNISVVTFSDAQNEAPHTINSITLHWSARARRR